MAQEKPPAPPSRDAVWKMFDRIAPRYDLLNHLLSFRRDIAWRKKLAQRLPQQEPLALLDLATGTGDVLLAMDAAQGGLGQGVGVDISSGMLRLGYKKIQVRRASQLSMMQGDAMTLALQSDSFDVITIAFGIRNVIDVDKALQEMYRVLRPGGKALILEFSLPEARLFRQVYLGYFRHVLPRIGGLISGDAYAYRYLNKTVESFPYGDAFCQLMRQAGFGEVSALPLSFGIATLYEGAKA